MNGPPQPQMQILHALRSKYAALVTLRQSVAKNAPREVLRSLAHKFPGALRELDQRSMADLNERLRLLDAAIAGEAPSPSWAQAQHMCHGFLRAALRLRPQLRISLAAALDTYVPDFGEPSRAQLKATWLQKIANPPHGRLTPLAYAFVAESLGLSSSEAEKLLDPSSHSEPA